MANKHITNACGMSGESAPPESDDYQYFIHPVERTTRAFCPECGGLTTINKGNLRFRSHNAA